jgi:hypothetical protein
LNPADAFSSVMPEGSIFLTFAESCGLALIFSEIGLLVVAVPSVVPPVVLLSVVVPVPVFVPVPAVVVSVFLPVPVPVRLAAVVVSVDAVGAFFGLPLPSALEVVIVAPACDFVGFVVVRGPPWAVATEV